VWPGLAAAAPGVIVVDHDGARRPDGSRIEGGADLTLDVEAWAARSV
jgi:hypothetical protein